MQPEWRLPFEAQLNHAHRGHVAHGAGNLHGEQLAARNVRLGAAHATLLEQAGHGAVSVLGHTQVSDG